MRRLFWRILLPALLLALLPNSVTLAVGEENLGKLDCVGIVVEDLPADAGEAGLTQEQLSDALLVALKSKIPRMKVDSSCPAYLYFNVGLILASNKGGGGIGYTFRADLEVNRSAYIRAIDKSVMLTVWNTGGLFMGPTSKAKATVLEKLNDFATAFAAAYYKAGNP
jgi:hypothetical protein